MKKVILVCLIFALVFSLCGCAVFSSRENTQQQIAQLNPSETADETAAKMAFTVIVIHKDGSEKTFTFETNEKYVGPVLTEAGLLEGNDGPYGLEITVVDGEKAVYAEDGAYWAVYEGEEYALQGIDTTPVKEGQVYKLVWTKA